MKRFASLAQTLKRKLIAWLGGTQIEEILKRDPIVVEVRIGPQPWTRQWTYIYRRRIEEIRSRRFARQEQIKRSSVNRQRLESMPADDDNDMISMHLHGFKKK